VTQLAAQPGFSVHYLKQVTGIARDGSGQWRVEIENTETSERHSVNAKFLFIGAGGDAVLLLQKSGIPGADGYGGFPVGGIWLRCDVDAVSERHDAKVYGKAPPGFPRMTVPHLDRRVIAGKKSLLFGPYAGFSTRFLKHGSLTDIFRSIRPGNILAMLAVAKDDWQLAEYLIGQVLQTSAHQFVMLQQFFPRAKRGDWKEAVAGQRVEIIKADPQRGGILEFGTEIVAAQDKSLVALLGASPGASTAASIALEVLRKCFADKLTENGWLPKLRSIIPTYGIDLARDADATRQSRAATAAVLKIDYV
jgi:malate dehydrogenase (quinone)